MSAGSGHSDTLSLEKTQNKNYKVAIVGGGLAGLTLAIQLADAGHSCVLFEKNSYPFHKVCGEYISMESWDFLERLGLNLSELNLPKITRLHVSSPSGKLLKHKLDLGGFGISRYLLDSSLAAIAREKGVELLEECRVNDLRFDGEFFTLESTKGNFTAGICVGAWGKKSNLDLKLRKVDPAVKPALAAAVNKRERNYVGIKYHVNIDLPQDVIELHNFKNGYCGISKIEGDRYCLCYLTDSENLKRYKGDIKKMEAEVLFSNPFLKDYFNKAKFLFEEPLAISQIKIGYKSAVENHIIMLGDTAGNIAPLSGNGMSMAMRSSFFLAQQLGHYFEKKITRPELEKKYESFWKKQFKVRVGTSGYLQKLLKNTSMTNLAISILKAVPLIRNTVVKSTHGKPF